MFVIGFSGFELAPRDILVLVQTLVCKRLLPNLHLGALTRQISICTPADDAAVVVIVQGC